MESFGTLGLFVRQPRSPRGSWRCAGTLSSSRPDVLAISGVCWVDLLMVDLLHTGVTYCMCSGGCRTRRRPFSATSIRWWRKRCRTPFWERP